MFQGLACPTALLRAAVTYEPALWAFNELTDQREARHTPDPNGGTTTTAGLVKPPS